MDCDINLEMIDKYLLQRCETAEYCVTNIIDDTSEEYIIRIGDKIYVLVIPEDSRK